MSGEELAALSHAELVQLVLRLQPALAAALARIATLEAQLGVPAKTPTNSSLPPSTAFKADRAARRRTARADGEPAPKRGPKPGPRGVRRARRDRGARGLTPASPPAAGAGRGAAPP